MYKFTTVLLLLTSEMYVFADAGKQPPARTITPFVDEQTFVIVRIDVSQVKLDALQARLAGVLPAKEQWAPVQRWLDALARAGSKEAYAGVSLSDPLGHAFAVIPLGKDVDQTALQPVLAMLPKPVTHRVHKEFLLIGTPPVLNRLCAGDQRPGADLEPAFTAVKDAALQGVVLLPPLLRRSAREIMPRLPAELGSESTEVIDKGFRWGAVGIDLPPRESLRIVIQAENADAAQALAALIKRGLSLLAKNPDIVANLPGAAQVLPSLVPKTEGDRISATMPQSELIKLLAPAIDKVRLAARRAQSINNLKQLGMAMHGFHDEHKSFPTPANYDANGKPLLSWRVHLLPLLNQGELYKEFHLNEPWDSAHNNKLLDRMPALYRSPLLKSTDQFMTSYVVPVGKNSIFPGPQGTKINEITDGTSNTILIVEVNDANAVIWTKPDDLDVDAKDALSRLVRPELTGFAASFADGSVRFLSQAIDAEMLQALFMRNDGKVVNVP